jgi:hypothetical protein
VRFPLFLPWRHPSSFCSWGLGRLHIKKTALALGRPCFMAFTLVAAVCSAYTSAALFCCLALLQAVDMLPCPYSC